MQRLVINLTLINSMMKISTMLFTVVTVISLQGITNAQAVELPDRAKRVLEQFTDYEERERKSAEEEILKKKRDVLKSLERYEKRVDAEGMRKLFATRIAKLKKEIAESEAIIDGVQISDIVDFDVVYHYKHPMQEHAAQRGEMIFTDKGKVRVLHLGSDGIARYDKEYDYKLVGGKLKFSDVFHGDIMVSKSGDVAGKKVTVEWAGLNIIFEAEVK